MLRRLALAAALLLVPASAQAHPHEFVTMKVTAQFDPSGQMTGMRYNWVFDEFFSAYAIEGQDLNGNGKAEQPELDALMAEILGNIKRIGYFTAFDENGVVPKIVDTQGVRATMQGRQLDLTFDLQFETPVTVTTDKPVRYAVYDDEFYIAMNHEKGIQGVSLQGAQAGCKAELTEPDPDDDLAAFAASLGKEESGGPNLGLAFAEWVAISCR